MKKMRKMTASVLCVITLMSMLTINVSAVKLPDGGQIANTGVDVVEGRSSGGVDGYANIDCFIDYKNGVFKDTITATTKSDVSKNLDVTNNVLAWYTTTSGGTYAKNQESAEEIPADGYVVTAQSANANGYKGTAVHNIVYDSRGTWICGTTIEY